MSHSTLRRKLAERSFIGLCIAAVALPLIILIVLMVDVGIDSIDRLNWSFLSSYPSRKAEEAGIRPGLVGSVYLIALTAAMALPIGVGAAVYLEEYAKRGWLANLIEINLANLAGVPSIIYGLLGLKLFVRTIGLGRGLLAGACTMALLILPIVILASREALRTVPLSIREGAYALGATRWQTVSQVVLPVAFPGILTGAILSVSRAIGEAAPLIVVGALAYIAFLPDGINSPFTVLPIQIFNWVSRPQREFLDNAAAGIVVLLVTMLLLNGLAIYLRNRLQKRRYW
ncbi:Phosphate transport system permease protein PstA (TC 3.A.1.7.1) [Olavius algarvensis spirochete endosymbiont]|uniref:phosphate ABC transporter permease PstA n=1 Tax=Olavius algarvensis spirochete endosymbiont TaxID=260710 RepID=UPI000F145592|nr:phosphate ABC transporter permease PstA [Olavius algarvensis spirochete endosymbiont]VDB00450.1 Phosphate transport system permease protein PstA (TC 3.A.1.7.1) [Olavius algarvensis spirochete endosymbiont]